MMFLLLKVGLLLPAIPSIEPFKQLDFSRSSPRNAGPHGVHAPGAGILGPCQPLILFCDHVSPIHVAIKYISTLVLFFRIYQMSSDYILIHIYSNYMRSFFGLNQQLFLEEFRGQFLAKVGKNEGRFSG